MKRRTNLFYNDSDDANFLTFSNYTEHLTGVFLSQNHKLYPSRFLCFYLPLLDRQEIKRLLELSDEELIEINLQFKENYEELIDEYKNATEDSQKTIIVDKILYSNKNDFINNYLVGYYENKLAALRSSFSDKNNKLEKGELKKEIVESHPDSSLLYLAYLIDCIMKYDDKSKLVYESAITEQDYNGTFTDIICTIDSSEKFLKTYTISNDYDNKDQHHVHDINEIEHLFGWEGVETLPETFKAIVPKFDDEINHQYFEESSIQIKTNSELKSDNKIVFNIIIPLYDIVNADIETNSTTIDEEEQLDIHILPLNDESVKNVPYGIWFANDTITLTRDINTNYSPSWSLLIGTQFKPFPYSKDLKQDSEVYSKMQGFATYAQILAKQTEIFKKYEEMQQTMENSYKIVYEYSTKIEQINDFIENIESINKKLIELQNQINALTTKIENGNITIDGGQFNNKWQFIQNTK